MLSAVVTALRDALQPALAHAALLVGDCSGRAPEQCRLRLWQTGLHRLVLRQYRLELGALNQTHHRSGALTGALTGPHEHQR